MVFVTVGACSSFHRLIQHLDAISPQVRDEIVMQIGESTFEPSNCEFFRYAPSLEEYFSQARLIVSHGGLATLETIRSGKPLIVVPRQEQFKEHFNDHQIEFAELLHLRFDVPYFLDVDQVTPDLLNTFDEVASLGDDNLHMFQKNIRRVLVAGRRE